MRNALEREIHEKEPLSEMRRLVIDQGKMYSKHAFHVVSNLKYCRNEKQVGYFAQSLSDGKVLDVGCRLFHTRTLVKPTAITSRSERKVASIEVV